LIRGYSETIASQFADETFDFVYIDGNHELKWVIQDLYAWIPKVKKGGVISGHDYMWSEPFPNLQVIEAVHAYTSANRIKKWYVLGRARKPTNDLRKIAGYARSWMWVNE
jgi:predicted O-methyltransferase YrrM